MNWFYADAGQQAGPINEADFERLAREGVIQPSTLVWREGMANWEPYSAVVPVVTPAIAAAPLLAPAPAIEVPPGQVICHECKKLVPAEDAMQINGLAICAACKPIYVQRLREGAVPLMAPISGLRYAGFWIRFGAKMIDGVLMVIVTLPFSFLFGFTFALNPSSMPDLATLFLQQGIVTVLGIAVRMLYTWLFVGRFGATPGKMVVGIKVVTPEGHPVSYGRAFGRYWAEIVSQLTCYIGYIIAAFDEEKRALHDRMCSTRVVYK